ncbi:MAG: phosphotransferase [Acidobacteriota bacterium]
MTTLKSTPDTPLPDPITAYLAREGLDEGRAIVLPLTGDASDRRYFRVIRPGRASTVLALHCQPFEMETLPFVNVAKLFGEIPVPVPAVLGHAADLGILVQQDLGDVTLQAHLGAAPPAAHAALYRQAVGFIDAMQRRGRQLTSDRYLPYAVAFDIPKLTWELEFFVKHFLVAYRGAQLTDAQRHAFTTEWADIAGELAAEPRVLCHRDYHSRNLMLLGEQLYIIDFQDARMGPDTYDLVSLLRDSYVDIREEDLEECLAYFLALQGRPSSGEAGREFRRRFDLMSLQRNLKALGTFGYQTAVRRNPVYIQYMPRTLRHAGVNLTKYARFGRLLELLASLVPELR